MSTDGLMSHDEHKTIVVVEQMLDYALRELADCPAGQGELGAAVSKARAIAADLAATHAKVSTAPLRRTSTN